MIIFLCGCHYWADNKIYVMLVYYTIHVHAIGGYNIYYNMSCNNVVYYILLHAMNSFEKEKQKKINYTL